jgi:hypothetical protein
MRVVHITFEKLTGLKGSFEGVFICDVELDPKLPLVFNAFLLSKSQFVFTQGGKYVYMQPVESIHTLNYIEQFYHGVNFLIKEWSYDSGARSVSTNSN